MVFPRSLQSQELRAREFVFQSTAVHWMEAPYAKPAKLSPGQGWGPSEPKITPNFLRLQHNEFVYVFQDALLGCPQIRSEKFNFYWVKWKLPLNTKKLKGEGDGWEPPRLVNGVGCTKAERRL